MKISPEIFEKTLSEGYYQKYPHLLLVDIPQRDKEEQYMWRLQKLGLSSLISENSILINASGYLDIPLNTSFNMLFPTDDIERYFEVNATMVYVNVNWQREIDYLPKGYTGTCLFSFEPKIPPILKKLGVYLDKSQDSQMFYLTQKPIIDRLLELTNQQNLTNEE